MSTANNLTFLDSTNAEYIAHLYSQYLESAGKVDASWQQFFGGLNDDEHAVLAELTGASWTPVENSAAARGFGQAANDAEASADAIAPNKPVKDINAKDLQKATQDTVRAIHLIRAYRNRGHMLADLDPLEMREVDNCPELDPQHHGFSPSEYDRPIFIGGFLGREVASVNEIVKLCKDVYSDKIGLEYLHISNPEERIWLQERMEANNLRHAFSVEEKKEILQVLTKAEGFEQFLSKKHPGTKRFGVDGGESLIHAIEF